MGKYIIKRLIWLIPIMIAVSLVAFFLMYLSPGDPAEMYLRQEGNSPSLIEIEEMREQMGLNRPVFVQYFSWLGGVFTGDMGISYYTHRPVAQEILSYFPNTLLLACISVGLTILISIPLGIIAAVWKNKWLDGLIRVLSFVSGSLPGFFAAMLVIILFSLTWKMLPTSASGNPTGIWLPIITLVVTMSGPYVRQVRAAVINELNKEYIQMERARGIKEYMILFAGALKSSLPSILTIAGLNFGQQLGGTAIIELVTSYPGIGRLAVQSITNRDYPLMQGYILVMGGIYVLVNLLVDILHAYADPRVKERYIAEGDKGKRKIHARQLELKKKEEREEKEAKGACKNACNSAGINGE